MRLPLLRYYQRPQNVRRLEHSMKLKTLASEPDHTLCIA